MNILLLFKVDKYKMFLFSMISIIYSPLFSWIWNMFYYVQTLDKLKSSS